MAHKYKIEEKVINKSNELLEMQSDFHDYLQDIGKATVLGHSSFMLDEKSDEKEIRKYITQLLDNVHPNAIEYYTEIKANLYK